MKPRELDLMEVDVMAILDFLRELQGEWRYSGWSIFPSGRRDYNELVQLIAKLEALMEANDEA